MIIKTPTSPNQDLTPDIFLAGGVTYSPDWQKEALKMLAGTDLIVANPRRDELISAVGAPARQQITWEFKNLKSAKVVLFWFPNAETIITFLELGKELARKSRIVVGVDPDYNRRFDIETSCLNKKLERVICSATIATISKEFICVATKTTIKIIVNNRYKSN